MLATCCCRADQPHSAMALRAATDKQCIVAVVHADVITRCYQRASYVVYQYGQCHSYWDAPDVPKLWLNIRDCRAEAELNNLMVDHNCCLHYYYC